MVKKSQATEEEKTLVEEEAEVVGEQSLEELAGLYTIETGLNSQVKSALRLEDEDKELVLAALNVLAEVIDRKITDSSTKRYLSLLLVFIKTALVL